MPGLLSTMVIKGKTVRNRIVLPPMATELSSEAGEVTEDLVHHYTARARAGVGLIIVEHSFVVPQGRLSLRQLGIHEDSLISGLSRLARAIKVEGAFATVQITHAGSAASAAVIGEKPVAPSAVPHPRRVSSPADLPVALTLEEISYLVRAFAAAARRAREAGFDAVELHGAHGFLLNQFLSPLSNRREDLYGGDRNGRLHLSLEAVAAVREAVGDDFPVFYRLGGSDHMPGGLTPEDGAHAARRLEAAGVDVIDLSGGFCGSAPIDPDLGGGRARDQGYFLPLAEVVKPATRLPLVITGGIRDPEFADSIVREGRADLVGIGRPLLANTQWAERAIQSLSARGSKAHCNKASASLSKPQ